MCNSIICKITHGISGESAVVCFRVSFGFSFSFSFGVRSALAPSVTIHYLEMTADMRGLTVLLRPGFSVTLL